MLDSHTLGVIVVSYNTRELLRKCLLSLQAVAQENPLDILVVDNASTDDSDQMVTSEFPDVRLILMEKNLGFAKANNRGMAEMPQDEVLLLNPDALANSEAIMRMRETLAAHPRTAIVGAQLVAENGDFQPSSFAFPSLWREFWNLMPELKGVFRVRNLARAISRLFPGLWRGSYQESSDAHSVDSISGACMLVRADALRQVQGFSEGFFLYHEEMELCYRLRKQGWEVWLEPRARVVHHEAQASGVRRFRLPPMPVLGYRLQGMDYFWATHHPGLPHIIWRSMACFLIRLRAVLLRIAGCFAGKTVRTRLSDRATELNQAARELKEKKQGLDS